MPNVEGTCGYSLVSDAVRSVDETLLDEDGRWSCPHDAEAGEDLCPFHQPVDDKVNDEVMAALSNALETASEGESVRNRASEFVGAKFERVELDPGTVVETHARFDHASTEAGFVAADVEFTQGLSARGAKFGSERESSQHGRSGTNWPSLEESINGPNYEEDHGEFPPEPRSERHVSFCGAEFGGEVTFEGASFRGSRHVSFAHADFDGAGDVSFTDAVFENRGHVAFNMADFEHEGDVSFEDAVFEDGDVSFSVTDYQNDGDVSFEDVTFRNGEKVAFHDSDFLNPAGVAFRRVTLDGVDVFSVRGTTFSEDVTVEIEAAGVERVCFAETDFARATLNLESIPVVDFSSADLTGADLSGVDLSGANLEGTILNQAILFETQLAEARLDGTVFGDAQVNEGTFENLASPTSTESDGRDMTDTLLRVIRGPVGEDTYRCVYDPAKNGAGSSTDSGEDEDGDPAAKAAGVYRQFEQLATSNALPKWQRRFFVLRKNAQQRQKTGLKRYFDFVQRTLFGYGASFRRVVGWSGGIVLAFAIAYLLDGGIHSVGPDGTLDHPVVWTQSVGDPTIIWDSLYYSTLTFTSLGFGGFRPETVTSQLLTVLETASGAILLALVVFVFGRRAAR